MKQASLQFDVEGSRQNVQTDSYHFQFKETDRDYYVDIGVYYELRFYL